MKQLQPQTGPLRRSEVQGEHRTGPGLWYPETDNATYLIQCLLFSNNMPFILLGLYYYLRCQALCWNQVFFTESDQKKFKSLYSQLPCL